MDLKFELAKTDEEIESICEYNIDAFSESPDFNWNLNEIKQEISDGWDLYAAFLEKEVIAAVFLKKDNKQLLTKTTSIKINYQGSGYSHKIKDFIEQMAKKKKLSRIVSFCSIDNFRMYSLNESHGYKQTKRRLGDKGQVVEWVKDLK